MNKMNIVTGKVSVHARGFGFVSAIDIDMEDIFVPARKLKGAVNEDIVSVEYFPGKNNKGPEGRVVEILERAHDHIGAIVVDQSSKKQYIAMAPLLGASCNLVVKTCREKLNIGDRIKVKITKWGNEEKPTYCKLEKKLGSITNPKVDIKAAIEEFNLFDKFSKKAVDEAIAFGKSVHKNDTKNRKDLTALETVTIDPKEAKDFDDAISLIKKRSNYLLYVHIADVSHYVKSKSHLDLEASKRGNSTYLPGYCVSMLPKELSDHLCSLKQGVKRLAVTIEMLFDKQGSLLSKEIYRSVIKSDCRFTYEEAKDVLDKKRPSKHSQLIHLMKELALLLKAKRTLRGSIDLALPDMRLMIDAKGMPYGFETIEYDITHQMIEEFMLKSNEVIAKHLTDIGKESIFRVHEEPLEDKMQAFLSYARSLGYKISDDPSQEEVQKLFQKANQSPHAYHLSVSFIRSMKLAYYSEENVGHFGLSLEHYTHFTSPIRRYSDLVIHRVLFEENLCHDLKEIAKACSDSERKSFRAETATMALKKLRLLEKYFDEDPYKKYEAIISTVKPIGISFELKDLYIEGFIHISQIGDDFYHYNEQTHSLKGEKTGKIYQIGSPILVELDSIDLVYKECEWILSSSFGKIR